MRENINADYTDWTDSLKNTSVICKNHYIRVEHYLYIRFVR